MNDSSFWARVDRSGECWLWMGSKDAEGYGYVRRRGVTRYAHRFAWELAHGRSPGALLVRHSCDNPSCVRPDHLELGTHADKDMVRRNRKRGGPVGFRRDPATVVRGECVGSAKLTADQVIAIRSDARPHRAVARSFNISPTQVRAIKHRKKWAHIPEAT